MSFPEHAASPDVAAEHTLDGGGRRATPASLARAGLLSAAIAITAGCSQRTDPDAARAEFSSKQRSLPAGRAPAGAPERAGSYDGTASAGRSTASRNTAGASLSMEGGLLPDEPAGAGAMTVRIDAAPTEAERTRAAEILRAAARSSWAALRANAIEAAKPNPSLFAELAPLGLVDENRGVRFVACMAIGEVRNRDLCVLVQPLLQDDSASVRAAAMLALSRCGQTVDLTPLAAMLSDNDPEVRGNAYLVLGELGNSSAVPLIRDSIGRGMKLVNPIRARLVDLTAAEALVKLGDDREIEPLRAALFAPPEQAELTLVACDAIGRLRDEVSRPMLERLLTVSGDAQRSPEIRLAAARALVALGAAPTALIPVGREYHAHPDRRVRSQAAALLGSLKTTDSLDLLARLILDGDPTVQVAAAAGIEACD
jgi:HEAT repeat protein